MHAADGFNPLRWKCETRGCFNEYQRPKIEVFAKAFPGRINFSDVDGIVEVAGNALMLEWKSAAMPIPTGQRIMYERITKNGTVSVLCVAGNAKTMDVVATARFFNGRWFSWQQATFDDAMQSMTRWAQWAKSKPNFGGPASGAA